MEIHYYLGWFNNILPNKLARIIEEDISDRKSLVMISATPFSNEEEIGAHERSWLDHADIVFENYYLIDYNIQKEDAKILIQNASAIFLLGGNAVEQNKFLVEYELSDVIKKSSAIVVGASAGAINMSAKWLCSKNMGFDIETSSICCGIGLDDFSILSHYDLESNMELVESELFPLSNEITIYASNKDCAVRVKENKIDILGDVYMISQSKIHKIDETL